LPAMSALACSILSMDGYISKALPSKPPDWNKVTKSNKEVTCTSAGLPIYDDDI
jgi:hypothetical protein